MRDHVFEIGEYYHIYNRGVDKRDVVLDFYDLERFMKSLIEFNTTEQIGSIYENSFRKPSLGHPTSKLVDIIAYCINPNHFHLILTPITDKGVERFMQKIGGYTKYFNERYKRNGSLFQGKFKSRYVKDNDYLLHLSVYVNMNNRDILGSSTSKLSKSSLGEYLGEKKICNASVVLDQFKNKKEYEKFARESWKNICDRKKSLKYLEEYEILDELGS